MWIYWKRYRDADEKMLMGKSHYYLESDLTPDFAKQFIHNKLRPVCGNLENNYHSNSTKVKQGESPRGKCQECVYISTGKRFGDIPPESIIANRRRDIPALVCEVTNKVKYETEERANRTLGKLILRGSTGLHTYTCNHCNWIHIGHYENYMKNFNPQYVGTNNG